MRLSRQYVPTLKESPAEAEVVSHKLMLRSGMIRKLTSGIYTYLPLGLRVLNKVAAIVREEMERAGALEVLLPMVQPGDLWRETGRWDVYGRELLRFKDRHERDFCLGPTHEEVITDLVRGEVRSYRQLPLNLYQVQTKFRDEIRPRFGLMRGREFLMKDAYSFDRDDAGADASYQAMFEAYTRTFRRLGLRFKAVEADSGAIGGSVSHEFMVLAETGEDIIASCSACAYAANLERAEVKPVEVSTATEPLPVETVDTPGKHTVEEVCEYLSVPPRRLVKTLVYLADDEPVAALVRGDRELNEVKLANVLSADTLSMAPAEVVEQVSGAPVGFAGPKGLQVKRVVADFELQHGADWVAGANQADAHHLHLDLSRDAEVEAYADLRVVTQEDPCPRCGAPLEFARGIEVGHVFKLGLKYSEAMECKYLDEQGKERPMVMGCYGIGVSRIVAAAIEQNHDARGVLWPPPIAPYETAVLSLAGKKKEAADKALELHDLLVSAGFEVLLDDRDERPGIKFNDADLVGCPMQLVAGDKGLARGVVEAKDRRTGERTEIPLDNFLDGFRAWREEVRKGWGLPG